jgi:hypothetical protein
MPHGLLGSWGVAVHVKEETVVKQVRMPPSATAPVCFVVLVGGDDGGDSRSIDSREILKSEGCHH